MKLSNKLILSFLFSIFVAILLISLISTYMINKRFDIYLVEEQQNKLAYISEEINSLYKANNFSLSQADINSYATLENVKISLKDINGNLIYSSSSGSGMMGRGMGMGRHNMMMTNIPEGNLIEKDFPLMEGDKIVGYLVIGYYDNSYLTESALVFKDTLTKSIFIASIFTIIIGILVSIGLSKSLTKPLINIRNTALEIERGNLGEKTSITSNVKEIIDLSDSINYLGDTLAKQEDIRKKYAQDISHELRTPLATLKSHLEAIIDQVWEADEDHLHILLEEINRMAGLVDDLKDSFKAEENHLLLNKTIFNLSDEINSVVENFKPIYSKEGFLLEANIEDNIRINMDKDKLNQIMVNLLSNSIRYLNPKGQVQVSAYKKDDLVILRVKDNGKGIKKENLPKIFDRFYRAEDNDSRGSGLGLPIVKSIVQAHGGSISIESIYGLGTEVTIELT